MGKLFLIGALGYPALEFLWRGRTHYSMSIAGGISALLIGRIRNMPLSFAMRTLLCGLGITGVEFLCGSIWNRTYRVWDYRHKPFNYQGQVCLPFSLAWCGMSAAMLKLLDEWEHNKHPDS